MHRNRQKLEQLGMVANKLRLDSRLTVIQPTYKTGGGEEWGVGGGDNCPIPLGMGQRRHGAGGH